MSAGRKPSRQPAGSSAPPQFDVTGQVALITGASRGLGAAMACALAQSGASIVLWARHRPQLERTAAAIRSLGARVWSDVVDVTDSSAVRAAVSRAVRGAGRLDILINNAGMWDGDPITELSVERWSRVLATDLTSLFLVSQAVVPTMIRQRRGVILHISSTSGILAHPEGSAYGAAKAGAMHLTRIMAVELGPYGIRVNGIAPGLFRTDMTADVFANRRWISKRRRRIPLRRFGEPEDVGGLAVFLASPASHHITGQTVIIDGGACLIC